MFVKRFELGITSVVTDVGVICLVLVTIGTGVNRVSIVVQPIEANINISKFRLIIFESFIGYVIKLQFELQEGRVLTLFRHPGYGLIKPMQVTDSE